MACALARARHYDAVFQLTIHRVLNAMECSPTTRLLCLTNWNPSKRRDTGGHYGREGRRADAGLTGLDGLPAIVTQAGEQVRWRSLEFFTSNIRNKNSRMAYVQAIGSFLARCEQRGIGDLYLAQVRGQKDGKASNEAS